MWDRYDDAMDDLDDRQREQLAENERLKAELKRRGFEPPPFKSPASAEPKPGDYMNAAFQNKGAETRAIELHGEEMRGILAAVDAIEKACRARDEAQEAAILAFEALRKALNLEDGEARSRLTRRFGLP